MSSTAILPSILLTLRPSTIFSVERLVEDADQVGVQAVLRRHGPQQGHGRELAALVDADADRLFFGRVELDPTAALGNDAAAIAAAVAGFEFADEVDAGAAVQLADDDALGTVDDELAAAEHDRHVAQVDFLFDRLLFGQPQPDAERAPVGQPQLAAFVGFVARLAQLVADVFQPQGLVVALDRENLPQHRLDSLILPLLQRNLVLQEPFVAAGLDVGQIGYRIRSALTAEPTNLPRTKTPFCRCCHSLLR